MDPAPVLFHLLVVLVAARLAAEVAERLGQPAVLAEIVAGALVGPSVLNLVGDDQVLRVLGELGAILLLLEVGMHMDLADLWRVGGDALRVALIGVLVPMAMGFAAMRAFGIEETVALFLSAGITATSVGITARVFGDLRKLASPEARTVLGAAVADDVAGLLVLTVVGGIASTGSISFAAVAGVVVTALGFVVAATAGGLWLVPRLVRVLSERARTEGTLLALGLALALLFARFASGARLAPIVGAFVAGLALSRSDSKEELHGRLAPLGHLLIPVFFLEIGIATRLSVFGDPAVLGVATVLTAVAIAGKLVAGLGVGRGRADRLLVGVAMIPRGEVGLIFAGIGLARGVLDARLYGVLVLVVLATTFIAPFWMRHLVRRGRLRAAAPGAPGGEPPGGWLLTDPETVELAADPPAALAHRIGLEAALACARRKPGPRLLDWLARAEAGPASWDRALRERLVALLREGNERSWRFLEATGLLASLLPELEKSMRRRRRDAFVLDPGADVRWSRLARLNSRVAGGDERAEAIWRRLPIQDLVLLSALARDAFEGSRDLEGQARRLAQSLGLGGEQVGLLGFLVSERRLLPQAAAHPDLGTEDSVLEVAAHLGTPDRADALYLLALAGEGMDDWERERLNELYRLVSEALAHPDLIGPRANDLIEARRREVARVLAHLPAAAVRRHLDAAPRRYLLAHRPQAIAHHLRMTETRPARFEARLEAEPAETPGEWTVHLALLDRRGLLASIAQALEACGVSVLEALVSTWRTGVAIDTFRVHAQREVNWEEVRQVIIQTLAWRSRNGGIPPAVEGVVETDNLASPWHTVVRVRASASEGLLAGVASALARAGLDIHSAIIKGEAGGVEGTFYVTGRTGDKLDAAAEQDLRLVLSGKAPLRWRRRRGAGLEGPPSTPSKLG